ncbi:MAG: hydroxyethylthiazole kinase, partial [Chloroflexi bacterium]|nr:hydroxyethylthiazole kinase [Chloroflexota bacterium]
MNEINGRLAEALARVREQKPLLHHITNYVVMNDTANVTLHIGALPVMAHAVEEVEEMVSIAGALVLNPGTLSTHWVRAMFLAGKRANERGVPIVLDPVGAGATTYRTQTFTRMLDELKITVLRGNSGEIGALSGAGGEVKGVESVQGVSDRAGVSRAFAKERGLVVAMSGKRDYVSDGERVFGVDNGHKWLTTLTGTGCMSTTMIAAFAAVETDPLMAAVGGYAAFGLAAEMAAEHAKGPASFKVAFFDCLYHLSPEQLA